MGVGDFLAPGETWMLRFGATNLASALMSLMMVFSSESSCSLRLRLELTVWTHIHTNVVATGLLHSSLKVQPQSSCSFRLRQINSTQTHRGTVERTL